MLTGSIYGWENGGDDIFNPHSARNRDDCLEPFRALAQVGRQNHIALHTADINDYGCLMPDFALYVESVDFVPCGAKKNYLLLYETSLTVPRNLDPKYLGQFDIIFTWNSELLKHGLLDKFGGGIPKNRFTQIWYPNPIPIECREDFSSPLFEQRPNTVCLIGSNRHANLFDERELYSERVRAIRWFEDNALGDFKLYGRGWNAPQKKLGRLGRLQYRIGKLLYKVMARPIFPSYQGSAVKKYNVLSKTKFCICFENARDIPGYMTEKIFDCFFAGCVPIYWGDPNVEHSIPPECFIDFRNFSSYEQLYQYLKKITPQQFFAYQEAARNFLKSPEFLPFSSQNFATSVIKQIKYDFGLVK